MDMIHEMKEMKEVLTRALSDLKQTCIQPKLVGSLGEEGEVGNLFGTLRSDPNSQQTAEPADPIKFPPLEVESSGIQRKTIREEIKEHEKRTEDEDNGFMKEMKQIIVDRDRDEFIRFKQGVAKGFTSRFQRVLIERSTPQDRINILQAKIQEKRKNLDAFLRMSERKIGTLK